MRALIWPEALRVSLQCPPGAHGQYALCSGLVKAAHLTPNKQLLQLDDVTRNQTWVHSDMMTEVWVCCSAGGYSSTLTRFDRRHSGCGEKGLIELFSQRPHNYIGWSPYSSWCRELGRGCPNLSVCMASQQVSLAGEVSYIASISGRLPGTAIAVAPRQRVLRLLMPKSLERGPQHVHSLLRGVRAAEHNL